MNVDQKLAGVIVVSVDLRGEQLSLAYMAVLHVNLTILLQEVSSSHGGTLLRACVWDTCLQLRKNPL